MTFPGSPAQRMTTASNRPSSSSMTSSTRRPTTRVWGSPRSRIALKRNETRLRRDSTRTSSTSPRTILSGIPGRPAPEPRSSSVRSGEGSTFRNSRLSRKRFSTIQCGSIDPTSRCVFCHLINKTKYLSNRLCSLWLSGRPRISRAPSAKFTRGSVTWRGERYRTPNQARPASLASRPARSRAWRSINRCWAI